MLAQSCQKLGICNELSRVVCHPLVLLSSASFVRATLIFAFLSLLEGLGDDVRNFMKSVHVEREKSVGCGIKNVLKRGYY